MTVNKDDLDRLISYFNKPGEKFNDKNHTIALEDDLRYLFDIYFPRVLNHDDDVPSRSDQAKGKKAVRSALEQSLKKLTKLKEEEEIFCMEGIEFLLPNYSESSSIFLHGDYPQGIDYEGFLRKTIEDYIAVCDTLGSKRNKNKRNIHDAGEKTEILRRLKIEWVVNANEPGAMTLGGGPSRFKSYLELAFDIADVQLPSIATTNKYLKG